MRQFKKDLDSKEDLLGMLDELSVKAKKDWAKICIGLCRKVIEKYGDDWKSECEIDCDLNETLFFIETDLLLEIKKEYIFRNFLMDILDIDVLDIKFDLHSIKFKLNLRDA